MEDFRTLQYRIAQIRAAPTADEYYGKGYVLLRECASEGQAILSRPFQPTPSQGQVDPETAKTQLKRILLDASARRFQAQKIYLRATAAMRWINSRNSVLSGGAQTARHAPALAQVDRTLATELAGITDDRTMRDLQATDAAQQRWLAEDPSLAAIRQWIARQR